MKYVLVQVTCHSRQMEGSSTPNGSEITATVAELLCPSSNNHNSHTPGTLKCSLVPFLHCWSIEKCSSSHASQRMTGQHTLFVCQGQQVSMQTGSDEWTISDRAILQVLSKFVTARSIYSIEGAYILAEHPLLHPPSCPHQLHRIWEWES